MIPFRIATVAGAAEAEADVAEVLGRARDVELAMRCMDRAEVLAVIRAGVADAIVIAGAAPWFDLQCRDEAGRAGIRVLGAARDPLDAEEFARQGIDVVDGFSVEELVERLRLPLGPPAPPSPEPAGDGKAVAVWGPKGAPGRTTLAIELAYALASKEPSTLLVDGDPYGGDIKQALGVVEEVATVLWAARSASKGALTPAIMAKELRRVGERGPIVLPGLPQADLWSEVSDHGWKRLLEASKEHFSWTVIDVGFCLEEDVGPIPETETGRNRMARAALASSDRVVVVFRADPVGVKNLIWSLPPLFELVDRDRCVLVANQVIPGEPFDPSETIRRRAGLSVKVMVPFAPADVTTAMHQGRALHEAQPSSVIVEGTHEVATMLSGHRKVSGFLSRLGGRR